MGGPLFAIFSGCFLNYMEQQIEKPLKPIFYRKYVDKTFVIRDKFQADVLYKNIKVPVEENPAKFIDTKLNKTIYGTYTYDVVNKIKKLPFQWTPHFFFRSLETRTSIYAITLTQHSSILPIKKKFEFIHENIIICI